MLPEPVGWGCLPLTSPTPPAWLGERRAERGRVERAGHRTRGAHVDLQPQGLDTNEVDPLERLREHLEVVGRVEGRVAHDTQVERPAVEEQERSLRVDRELHRRV